MEEARHEHGCSAEHHCHHGEEGESLRGKILLIVVTVILLGVAVWIEKTFKLATWQQLLIFLIPYLLVGHDTIHEAIEGVMEGDVFNEDFLMTVATVGALCIGFLPGADSEFPEAVFVMLFFQIGELFEHYAEGKSRRNISHLMNIRPDVAHVKRNGMVNDVSPKEVAIDEVIEVRPGEKVPLDGVVIKGSSSLNTLALTGESMPRDLSMGDAIISGCINMTGVIEVRTTKSYGESTVSKIISMVEHADANKSKSESFITKFARIYTPIVVFMALALAFLPPLLASEGFLSPFPLWLYRALIFLIVSCPCALVISVPLTFFGGIGGASRNGILVKGSNYIDALANIETVVFDKTGTLTHGRFEVEAIHPDHFDERQLLHLAAHVEHFTTHPIGIALREAFPEEDADGCSITDVEEIAGAGVRAVVNGQTVCVGNWKMMKTIGVQWHECHKVGTIIHVSVDGVYVGHIIINDKIKEDSHEALTQLKRLGVRHTVMLTGDREEVAANVAQRLELESYYAELLPTDKVAHIERLLAEKTRGKTLAFVGDGINDAPVLKRADIGIAMGALGSDAAIEAADVVLMDDKPSKISFAIRIARRTRRIAKENVCFAIGVKVAVLGLAVVGIGNMWMAVMADVGVTVIAVFNAMRALVTPRR